MSLLINGKELRVKHLNICSLRIKVDDMAVLLLDNNIHILFIFAIMFCIWCVCEWTYVFVCGNVLVRVCVYVVCLKLLPSTSGSLYGILQSMLLSLFLL